MRPLLLDLYCCSGGSARGYYAAGFDVTGVDINPQPRFPYPLIEADALWYLRSLIRTGEVRRYTAIHASPPCQRFSPLLNCRPGLAGTYPDLIEPTRKLLVSSGLPWVIENVEQAPLKGTVLCGTQFNRRFRLHRVFEASFPIPQLPCDHSIPVFNANSEQGRRRMKAEYPGQSVTQLWLTERGIDWTRDKKEYGEALSPFYTEYVGGHLMRMINSVAA